ncbi:MAG: hypothetical protein WCJ09_02860 [Planctomycetota bacterium]
MKYMLLVYSPEEDWTEEERARCMVDSTAVCHELNEKGQFRAASPYIRSRLLPVCECGTDNNW